MKYMFPGTMCSEGSIHNYSGYGICTANVKPTSGYYTFATEYTTINTCDGGGASPGDGGGTINTGPYGGYNGGGGLPDFSSPCEKLKQLLNSPISLPSGAVSIKTALEDLKSKNMATADHEEGYTFFYDPNTGQMYAKKVTAWNPKDNSTIYEKTPNTFGGAHTHMNSLQGMFSHDDIMVENNFFFWFTSVPQGGVDVPIPVHIVVANNQVYALAVEDANINSFQQMMYGIYSDEFKRRKFRKNFEADFSNLQNSVTGEWSTDNNTLRKIFKICHQYR